LKNKIIKYFIELLPSKFGTIFYKIQNSDIGRRISVGAFWTLFGSITSNVSTLLALILVARILGKSEFGEFGMIKSTVNTFAVFGGFGLGLTATKYISEIRHSNDKKIGNIIGITTIMSYIIGFFVAIIIFLFSHKLAENTINAPHLGKEIQLASLIVFLSSINGVQSGILSGFENFKFIAISNIISAIISFPIQLLFAYYMGLRGALIGLLLSFFLKFVINEYLLSKQYLMVKINPVYKIRWNDLTILLKFSLPSLLSGLMVGPIIWVCNTMLVSRSSGYNEMAIFEAATQWKNTIAFLPGILSSIVLPLISSTTIDKVQFEKILNINIKLNFYISLLISIIISIFSTLIMKTFGLGFINGANVLIILAVSTILSSVNSVIGQALAGKDRMWVGFLFNLIWGAILIFFSNLFIKLNYGALGLAMAFLISYLFHSVIQFLYLKFQIYNKWDSPKI
jgi:O-antigen/teichoic acid export membrane protein